MKRLAILFAILISLGGIAYYLNSNSDESNSSLTEADRNFSYPREQIGKITLQKVGKEMQTFTRREGGHWYINDEFKVSQFSMPYLLQTLCNLKIQNLPSRNSVKNIIKDIKKVGIQVKIYDLEGSEVRSYKVGLESYDDRGTVFMMDGYYQPYNMYLKGFDGNMRSRLFQTTDKWRDKEVWQYDPNDIVEVGIKYHKNQKESFLLNVEGSNIDVKPLSQFITRSEKEVDQDRAKAYLSAFTRVYAEEYDNANIRKDSIRSLLPFATIAVKDKTGHVNEVQLFPFNDITLKNVNTKDLIDAAKIERYFLYHSKGDFMITQTRMIKEVFRPYSFFLKE